MKQSTQFTRTSEELDDIVEDTLNNQSDEWDGLADEHGPLVLTDSIPTDECYHLVFNTGLVVRLYHPEAGPFAHDGDRWDVTPLGWS